MITRFHIYVFRRIKNSKLCYYLGIKGGGNVKYIDDNMTDIMILKERLYRIFPESHILQARSLKQAHEISYTNKIDLALLDLNLPDGFGPRSVNEFKRFSKSSIIAISEIDFESTGKDARKYGAIDFVNKSSIFSDAFENIVKNAI